MLVSLSYSKFSPKKTDKQVTRQVIKEHEAAENAGKFVKQILPEEALEAIKKLEGEIRKYYYAKTFAWTDEGARILPSDLYMEFTDKMRGFTRKFDPLVDAFIDKLDDYIEAQRKSLKGMFKLDDYPSKDEIRGKFKFKTSFLPFPNGADFRVNIADQEMAALKVRIESDIEQAQKNARNDLWQRLAVPLQTMAKSLGNPDGKVYTTVVGNVIEIVDQIPALNITGDQNLERIRAQVKADLCHVSVKSLRKNPSQRRDTAQKANDILATMAGYLGAGAGPAAAPLELPPLEPESVDEEISLQERDDVALEALPVPPPTNIVPMPAVAQGNIGVGKTGAAPAWRRRFIPATVLLL